MYVVSYCIIIAFHPELKLPSAVIYQSYDKNKNEISSLSHFQILNLDFFKNTKINKVTLKQLENPSFPVQNKDNCNALAEMFNIELKFTADCLKSWFQHQKVLKLDEETKMDFRTLNPQTNETICTICYFPLNPRVENGWAEHVFKAEYLFLENIFSQRQLVKTKIENFDRFSFKLNKILDNFDEFCKSVNQEADDEIIEKIKKIKTTKEDENKTTKEKALCLMYISAIIFLPTKKVKGDFPMSENFLSNMIPIAKDQRVIHHSHVTGKTIGYAHDFCNEKIRENCFTIAVLAHNQFRFYFLFF